MDINDKKGLVLKTLEANTGNVAKACRAANIARSTFYKWLDEDPKFQEAYKETKESLIDFAESQLHANIKAKKEASIFFFLKTQAKDRGYIEKQEIDHTTKGESFNPRELTDDELEEKMKELDKSS